MIKKTETIICDDCGQEIHRNDYIDLFEKQFCKSCIKTRVYHSFSIRPNRKCNECNGSGKIKESCGYHNDYEWVDCTRCYKGFVMYLNGNNDIIEVI